MNNQTNLDLSFVVAEYVLFKYQGTIGNPTYVFKGEPMDKRDFVCINYDTLADKKHTAFIPIDAYLHWQSKYYEAKQKELENAVNS